MPPLHPLLVHFPIALLTSAAALEAAAFLLKRDDLSRAGWWFQLAGTLAIGAAVLSGIVADDAPGIPAAAAGTMESHEELAFLASGVFGALLLWRVAAKTRIPGPVPLVYLGVLCGAVLLLLLVAWFGGELVYRHGVGVATGLNEGLSGAKQ